MKDKENIEFKKLISEKYDGYAPPPSEELWDKVYVDIADLKVAKFKKRAAYYKWLSLGLLLLLITGGILYQFKDENKIAQLDSKEVLSNNEQDNENIFKEESTTKAITNETIQSNENNKANQLIVKQESERIGNTQNKESNTANEVIENVQQINENSIDESNQKNRMTNIEFRKDNKVSNSNDKNKIEKIDNKLSILSEPKGEEKINTNEGVDTEEGIRGLNNKLDDEESKTIPPKTTTNNITKDNITLNPNNKDEIKKTTDELSTLSEPEEKTNTNEANDKEKKENNDSELPINVINQVHKKNEKTIVDSLTNVIVELNEQLNNQDSISDNDTDTLDIASKPDSTTVPPVVSEKSLSKITVSAVFLPTYSYRSLQDAGGNATDFYNTNQNASFQYNAGIGVGYNISNKLTVNLGVDYNKLNQEVKLNDKRPKELPILQDPDNKKITFYSSLGTVEATNVEFDFAGDDQDDIDLDDEDDFASLNFKEEQKFTFLNIPVTLRYELGKKRFKLLLQGGVITSITLSSSSKITLANIHKPEDIIEVKDYHQTKSFSFGGTISIGAKYDITKRFSVLFLPTYNNFFTNLNNDSATKIKPYNFNFSTGLQYRF